MGLLVVHLIPKKFHNYNCNLFSHTIVNSFFHLKNIVFHGILRKRVSKTFLINYLKAISNIFTIKHEENMS